MSRNIGNLRPFRGSSGSGSGVSRIIAGENITIDPVSGVGVVTINSTGGGAAANSFTISVSEDFPTSGSDSNVAVWNDVVDTGIFPMDPNTLYSNWDGTIDFSTGTFTIPVTGEYFMTLTQRNNFDSDFDNSPPGSWFLVRNEGEFMLMTGNSHPDGSNPDGSGFGSSVHLDAGDSCQLVFINTNADDATYPYVAYIPQLSGTNFFPYPAVIFSCFLLGGSGGGTGGGVTQLIAGDGITLDPVGGTGIVTVTAESNLPEAFNIYVSVDPTVPTTTGYTYTMDFWSQGPFPGMSAASFYGNFDKGSWNLNTGSFTPVIPGPYIVSLVAGEGLQAALYDTTTGEIVAYSNGPAVTANLEAGHLYQPFFSNAGASATFDAITADYDGLGNPYPNFIFGLAFVGGNGSGAGSGGVVEVSAGAGISIGGTTSYPIVENEGVLSVEVVTPGLTVDVSDPRVPILMLGNDAVGFSARSDGLTQVVNTGFAIVWDGSGPMWWGSIPTANGGRNFVAPVTGIYQSMGQIMISGTTTKQWGAVKNGAYSAYAYAISDGTNSSFQFAYTIPMSAGDSLQIAYIDTGSVTVLQTVGSVTTTWWSVTLVR